MTRTASRCRALGAGELLGRHADGLVALSPLTDNCAPGTQEAVQKAQADMMAGSLAVFQGPLYDNRGRCRWSRATPADQEILSMTWLCQGVILNEN